MGTLDLVLVLIIVFVGEQEYLGSKTGFLHILNTVVHHSQNNTHFHVLEQYLVLVIVIVLFPVSSSERSEKLARGDGLSPA